MLTSRPKRALKSVKLKGLARIHLQQAPRPGRRRRKMSAVARPTFVVVASLLVHRATANNDDDDDESNEHLSYAVWIALGLFVILFLLFDLLRTRMWWVYEPRLHHDSYRSRTPQARFNSGPSSRRRPGARTTTSSTPSARPSSATSVA